MCSHLMACALALLAVPALARAATDPVIAVVMASRQINLDLVAENSSTDPGGTVSSHNHSESLTSSPFTASFTDNVSGDGGAMASGSSSQMSTITNFKIEGQGNAEASASRVSVDGGGYADGNADANSIINLQFTVPVDATFAISGSIEVSSTGANNFAQVTMLVFGTAPNGIPFQITDSVDTNSSADPKTIFHVKEIKAGTDLFFTMAAAAGAAENTSSASFKFELNIGDEDGDGLLDAWETDGIDIDEDGTIDIDLPAMGAKRRKKDVFVELDAMSGVAVNMTAINRVKSAFALAPAGLILNPDSSAGITLHVNVDETNLPVSIVTGLETLDGLKANHFGPPSDQMRPDKEQMKLARSNVFRYCLWAAAIVIDGEPTTGVGERPGNDFIVAAAFTANVFSNAPTDALAGTFMHELGHTLGLRHGGVDGLNFKPNYLSVMNYTYQAPYPGSESAWVLDYSGSTLNPLDEAKLFESIGVDGPASKDVMFNSAPAGQTPVRTIVYADSTTVDWNQKMGISVGSIEQDITRLLPDEPASPNEKLNSATDWGGLHYKLSGDANFEDGVGRIPGSIPVELTETQIQAIASTVVLDFTICLGDANADNTVNFDDITAVLSNWLNDYTPGTGPGDANTDGLINFDDITAVLSNWLATCP